MKQTLFFCLTALAFGGFNHSLRAQSHLEVGAQTLVQRFVGNSNATTGPWSPGMQIQGIRSSNGFRYGVNVASVQMAYSETTYRWGQLGLVRWVRSPSDWILWDTDGWLHCKPWERLHPAGPLALCGLWTPRFDPLLRWLWAERTTDPWLQSLVWSKVS